MCDFNSIYLNQSSVPAVIQILKNTLFPVTFQRPWSSLGALKTLAPTSACITLVSWCTCWTRGPFRSLGALRTLSSTRTCFFWWTWETLFSRSTFITFVSSWACGSFRSMIAWWSCGTSWSCRSWVPWDPWNSWCTETSTVTTRPIRGRLLSALDSIE